MPIWWNVFGKYFLEKLLEQFFSMLQLSNFHFFHFCFFHILGSLGFTIGSGCSLMVIRPQLVFSFYTVHEILMASILGWFAIPSSNGSCFVRTLFYDLSVLGDPAWHGSQLHWVMQAPSPWQGSDTWRGNTL